MPSRDVFARLFGVIALAAVAGCTKFDALNAAVPSGSYRLKANVRYGELARQKLDVYQPRHAAPGAPVVIFFYGGSWQAGSKRDYRFVGEALASRGFVAVLPDYRLSPDVTFPAFVEDGARAVRWVHDHAGRYGGDPCNVFLMGHSAGAHIAVLLTLDPHYLGNVGLDRDAIRGTAALSGPYDFIPGPDTRAAFGLDPTGSDPPAAAIEPITFAANSADHASPLLLVHGLEDDVVEPAQAIRLATAIRLAGGNVQYLPYPTLGHAGVALALAAPFRWLAPVLDDTAAFFRTHVSPPACP